MNDFPLLKDHVETLKREFDYLRSFGKVSRASERLNKTYGFIFRCTKGPFNVEEFMLEDFSIIGNTKLILRRDTSLLLDGSLVWFDSPETAAKVVENLIFDFPSPLAHVFMRTPICEIQVRIQERERQISTLMQIINPSRN